MNFKILNTIGKEFAPEGKDILASFASVDYEIPLQEELPKKLSGYDAALIGLGLNFHKEGLDAAVKLKVLATATTGLDHLDVEYAGKKGIEILSLRGEEQFLDTISGTAELALGLMIDLVRRTPWAFDSVKKYEWKRDSFKGITLQGKTLGVIGLGRLGRMMARHGKAIGMRVIFVDPFKESTEYEKTDFDTVLQTSDIISIHVHLLPETTNMFDARALGKMKKTAVIVNTSRGKIVDEQAVFRALK